MSFRFAKYRFSMTGALNFPGYRDGIAIKWKNLVEPRKMRELKKKKDNREQNTLEIFISRTLKVPVKFCVYGPL